MYSLLQGLCKPVQDMKQVVKLHAMREIFTFDDTGAILLVDTSNAFNAINRQAALYNIQVICPAIAMFIF